MENARNGKCVKITRQAEKYQSKFFITYNQLNRYSNRLPPS